LKVIKKKKKDPTVGSTVGTYGDYSGTATPTNVKAKGGGVSIGVSRPPKRSYLRLIDFCITQLLDLRVIKKKKKNLRNSDAHQRQGQGRRRLD